LKGWLIIVALAVLLMAGSLVRLVVAHGCLLYTSDAADERSSV